MSLVDDLVWLIDIPSPTGSEEGLRDAVAERLSQLEPRIIGKSVVVGRRTGRPLISLYGHLDTVPEQGNLPGRIDDGVVLFGKEELSMEESPLPELFDAVGDVARADLAVVLEPTDGLIHAYCSFSSPARS